jgi:hypothetical protein
MLLLAASFSRFTTSGGDWFGSDLRRRAWEDAPKLCPHVLDGLSSDEDASITRREDRVDVVCLVCKRRSNSVGVLAFRLN